MFIRRKVGRVEDQRRKDFVGNQVDGFGLAESQAGLELRSSEAAAKRVVRVRKHQRFDWAGCFLECGFEFAQERGWLFETGYAHDDGDDVGAEAAECVVTVCNGSASFLAGVV